MREHLLLAARELSTQIDETYRHIGLITAGGKREGKDLSKRIEQLADKANHLWTLRESLMSDYRSQQEAS
jgi:hypothetical protein